MVAPLLSRFRAASIEPMTHEGHEATYRRFSEAIGRGDLDGAAAELAPTVEIDDRDIPDADGRDSFHEWVQRWNESWESWRLEDVELQALGDGRILALFRMIATGRTSGIEIARDDAVIAEFRDGKISRIGYYNDQDEARRAAGIGGT